MHLLSNVLRLYRPLQSAASRLPEEIKHSIAQLVRAGPEAEHSKADLLAYTRLAMIDTSWRRLMAPLVYETLDMRNLNDLAADRRSAAVLPGLADHVCNVWLGSTRNAAPMTETALLGKYGRCLSSLAGQNCQVGIWAHTTAGFELGLSQLGAIAELPIGLSIHGHDSVYVPNAHFASAFAFRRLSSLELRAMLVGQEGQVNGLLDTLASIEGLKALSVRDMIVVGKLSTKVLCFACLNYLRCETEVEGSDAIIEPLLSRCAETLHDLVLTGFLAVYRLSYNSEPEEGDNSRAPPRRAFLLSVEMAAISRMSSLRCVALEGFWGDPEGLVALRYCTASHLLLGAPDDDAIDQLIELRTQSDSFWPFLERVAVTRRHLNGKGAAQQQRMAEAVDGLRLESRFRRRLQQLDLWKVHALLDE